MSNKPRTLYEKIWDAHVVDRRDDGTCLIYIDRHLVHEVTSPQAFEALRAAGRKVRRPDLTLAVPDHNLPTTARHAATTDRIIALYISSVRMNRLQVVSPPARNFRKRGFRGTVVSSFENAPDSLAYRGTGPLNMPTMLCPDWLLIDFLFLNPGVT